MPRVLNLVELARFPIHEQLHLEEKLLRNCDGFYCLTNFGAPPAYVLPISAKKEEWLQEVTHPVIRRYTGGGGVVIDESTLFVTFIGPAELLNSAPTPSSIHEFAEKHYAHYIPGFIRKENDYCIDDRKIGGNAQYISKNRFVHHTSFLWDFDPKKMAKLKTPPRMPSYRNSRSHEDFVATLKSHFQSPTHFFDQLKTALLSHYKCNSINLNSLQAIKNQLCRIATFIDN